MSVMVIIRKRLLFLLLVLNTYMNGQEFKKRVIAGVAYNTLSEDLFVPFSVSYAYYNRFSPYLGVDFEFKISERNYLQVTPYYVQRNIRFNYVYDSPNYYVNVDQKFKLHYISFPLIYNFKLSKFKFGIGIEGSFLLQANSRISYKENNGYTGKQKNYVLKNKDYDNLYQVGDVGYVIVIGYSFKRFDINFNYYHGMIPPPKFNIFPAQRFAFQYTYQQTFRLGVSYPIFNK